MTQDNGSIRGVLMWQRRRTWLFVGAGFTAWLFHHGIGWTFLGLSPLAVSVIGAAIGIFASFRTNAAYDRWWEGRKLWGRLVNRSRHLAHQARHYLPPEVADPIVRRHIAYVHTLRCALRTQPAHKDAEAIQFLNDAERAELATTSNGPQMLLDRQHAAIMAAYRVGHIDGLQLQSFDDSLMDLLGIQGGCERIKGTPLPRGYGWAVDWLIDGFGLLFPFALVSQIGLVTIPMNLFVGMGFTLISEIGRILEDPFTMFFNGLPLSELSRKIEVNLRERLGDEDLPPMLRADARGILM